MPIISTRLFSHGGGITIPTVVASFTGSATPIRDYTLELTDTSTGTISSWLWILTGSGGIVATSTDQNPTFGPDILQPLGPDDYDVELIVNGLTGQSATDSFAVTADGLWLGVPVLNGTDIDFDILLATDELGAVLASPDTFDLEITDEDDNILASKSGLVWDDDAGTWTTTQMLFSGTANQGGTVSFATESRSTYKITLTTTGTYPTSHSRTIVVHPAQPSVAATFSRITEFDPDSVTDGQITTANTTFAGLTPGDLSEFIAVGVGGLTNGFRNALDANSNTYPQIVRPVNGGPAYVRYNTTNKRRCQTFLSKEGATGLPGMGLVRGAHYRFGFDFRVPIQSWWDSFKAGPAGTYFVLSSFHTDVTNDVYTSGPSGTMMLRLDSRNDIAQAPYLQIRVHGDEVDDSTAIWATYTCGMKDDSGRWAVCYPVSSYSWANSEPTLIDFDFEPGKWYRFLVDFKLDNGLNGFNTIYLQEIDLFAEDASSKIIEEMATTNTFPISGTYSARTMREAQIGISNVNAEIGGWTPPTDEVNIDFTRYIFDVVDEFTPVHNRPETPQTPTSTVYCDAAASPGAAGTIGDPFDLTDMLANLAAGQLVYIKGDFGDNNLLVSGINGTSTEWIIFRKWPGEAQPIFNPTAHSGVYMLGGSYMSFEDLELHGSITEGAVAILDGAHHIHVVGCTLTGPRSGWCAGVTAGAATRVDGVNNVWIDGNTIDEIGSITGAFNDGDGVYVSSGTDTTTTDVWVVRNTITRCGHGSISVNIKDPVVTPGPSLNPTRITIAQNDVGNVWSGGILITGAIDVVIENNDVHDVCTDFSLHTGVPGSREGIILSGSTDGIVRRNRVWDCYGAGIMVQANQFSSTVQEAIGNSIYHNTVVNCGGSLICLCRIIDGTTYWADNSFTNNLFWSCHEPEDASSYDVGSGFRAAYTAGNYQRVWIEFSAGATPWALGDLNGNTWNNNWFARNGSSTDNWAVLVSGNGGPYDLASFEALNSSADNVTVGNPLLTNVAADDFTLQVGSPLINAGVVIPGQPYYGSAPDIGAYEKA